MIFVILGTQKIPFPRLLKAVDELIESEKITEEVVAQSGHTHYEPRNFKCIPFLSEEQFQDYIEGASAVITHSGSGSIFSALRHGRKTIAVARLHRYGEMVDDHQIELVKKLSEDGYVLDGTESLREAWAEMQTFCPRPCDFDCRIPEELEKFFAKGSRHLFVCNRGGHYSEMMSIDGICNKYDVYMLSDNDRAGEDFGDRAVYFDAFNYSSDRKLKFINNIFTSIKLCLRLKPHCIVSTGAGIAVPVFMVARLFGIKLVFIESRARVWSKSRAGKYLARICDSLIVQWPEMVGVYGKKAKYLGTLK